MIKLHVIAKNLSIKQTIRAIDKAASKTVFVLDNNQLIGAVSDGDIRRAILNNVSMGSSVETIMNKHPIFIMEDDSIVHAKSLMLKYKIEAIPRVNHKNEVIEILLWNKIFEISAETPKQTEKINLPVVIMAGGKGARLDPFTRILPKPLIPIGDDPIIKIIIDEFRKFGINEFCISLNHKAHMVKAYFNDYDLNCKITYLEEKKPLGTAGALKFLINKISTSFFVTNCDILVFSDYCSIYDFHEEGNYKLTIVGSMQHHVIPYGVCEIQNGGLLKNIKEKPEYDFLVNTGMYLLKPDVLEYIPDDVHFDMTDLIKKVQEKKGKVGVYPISEKSWIDVGQWGRYHKSIELLSKKDRLV